MTYPTIKPADFRAISYERSDQGTQPRVLVTGYYRDPENPSRTCVQFHIAGDECERVGYIDDVVQDDAIVSSMEPTEALRAGIEWEASRSRRRNLGDTPAAQATASDNHEDRNALVQEPHFRDDVQERIERLLLNVWCLADYVGVVRLLNEADKDTVDRYISEDLSQDVMPVLMEARTSDLTETVDQLCDALGHNFRMRDNGQGLDHASLLLD